MADVPPTKKPVTKAVKPVVVKPVAAPAIKAEAVPVAAKPVPAVKVEPVVAKKPVPAKPVVAKPVLAKAPEPVKPEPVKVAPPVAPVAKVATPELPAAQPVIEKPVAAKPAAVLTPEPVKAPAPIVTAPAEPVIPPAVAAPIAVAPAPKAAPAAVTPVKMPALAPAVKEGKSIMNETITTIQDKMTVASKEAADRATALLGDLQERTKTAVEKSSKAVEDLVEFSKGNLEAVVASGRVAAKGAEDIAKYSADYGRASLEKANATAKQFAAVKSPTEFFQLQSEVAKSAMDTFVAESAKFTESYLKLLGEIAQPISNRYAVAAEKVKTAVAA